MINKTLLLQIRSNNMVVLIVGWLLVLTGVFAALILNTTNWWNLTLVVSGLVVLALFLAANLTEVKEVGKKRTTIARASLTLVAFSMLGVVAALNYIASRHPARFDLTSNKFYSLSEQTLNILDGLKKDVNATLLTAPTRSGQVQPQIQRAQQLLEEYGRKSTKFHFKLVDIDRNPAEAHRLGIRENENNIVVFESGENRKDVLQREYVTYAMQGRQPMPKFNGEPAFTSALLTMSDTVRLTFYFTEGHGERELNNPQPGGYSTFKDMLEKENYTIKTLNLLKENKIPADAAVIAIVGPLKAFQPTEAALLENYVKQGGKVMLCADLMDNASRRPIPPLGLSAILKDFGVKLRNDIAIDTTSFMPPNASAVLPQYNYHPVVEKLIESHLPSLMVFSRAVEKVDAGLKGANAILILQTTDKGWGITNLKQKPVFHPGTDVKGPVPMAVASEWLVAGGSGKKARLVVYGNSNFFSNQFNGTFANLDLALNTFSWLAEQENKISIHPKVDENRVITLTNVNSSFIFYLTVIIIPLSALITGFMVWFRRRSI